MYFSKITALTAALAATSSATTFYLSHFTASDFRLEGSHDVSFNVSSHKHHVPSPASCDISWTDSPPDCLTRCGDSEYYAEVVPGTYEGAYDFDLKVTSARKTATFNVQEGEDDYFCSRGGQSTICSYATEGSSTDAKAHRARRGGVKNVCH